MRARMKSWNFIMGFPWLALLWRPKNKFKFISMTLILQKQSSKNRAKYHKKCISSYCSRGRRQAGETEANRQQAAGIGTRKQGELVSRISKANTRACGILQNKQFVLPPKVLLLLRFVRNPQHQHSMEELCIVTAVVKACARFSTKDRTKIDAGALSHILVNSK